MTKSFRAVLKDKNVKAIMVNVFAGINRCDWVAKGVVDAIQELEIKVPVIVRLAGTNVEEGRRIIDTSGLSVISAQTLGERRAEGGRGRAFRRQGRGLTGGLSIWRS